MIPFSLHIQIHFHINTKSDTGNTPWLRIPGIARPVSAPWQNPSTWATHHGKGDGQEWFVMLRLKIVMVKWSLIVASGRGYKNDRDVPTLPLVLLWVAA